MKELSDSDFFRGRPRTTRPTLVFFYAPWCPYCTRMKAEWAALASKKHPFDVVAVDAARYKALAEEADITGFPTIRMYADGKVREYEGVNRDAKSFASFAHEALPFYANDPLVEEFDDDVFVHNRKPAFVLFYAPWCGFCKGIKDMWRQVAHAVGSNMRFGAVDCTRSLAHKRLADRMNIQSYPTIMMFVNGRPRLFQGERSVENLLLFAAQGLKGAPWPQEVRLPQPMPALAW